MLGRPVNVLRKYCVPETAGAEPSVTAFQLPSAKLAVFQSAAMLDEEEVIFHSTFFMTG